jgi:hypothetical protein
MGRLGVVVLLLVAAGLGGWHYRARIVAFVNPPPSAAHPAEKPDVLYSWVDRDGVTHFSQESGKGTRMEYDGSRITPVAPVETSVLPDAPALEEKKQALSGSLHEVRQKLMEQAQQMREAKQAAHSDL